MSVLLCVAATTLVFVGLQAAAEDRPETAANSERKPRGEFRGLMPAVNFDVSPPLRDMNPIPPRPAQLRENEDRDLRSPASQAGSAVDPVTQSSTTVESGQLFIAPPLVSFDGQSNIDGVTPAHPVAAAGPNHIVAMSDLSFQIFTKQGTSVFGPAANNPIWAGFRGACEAENGGQAVVLGVRPSTLAPLNSLARPT